MSQLAIFDHWRVLHGAIDATWYNIFQMFGMLVPPQTPTYADEGHRLHPPRSDKEPIKGHVVQAPAWYLLNFTVMGIQQF